jgi:hypothetical protein
VSANKHAEVIHVKRLVVLAMSVLVSAAAATAGLSGGGVASAAPNLTGALYKDAKAQLAKFGLTPIVKSRTGDRVRDDECVVDFIQDAPGAKGKVFVSLNCYANVASQYGPGYSLQSPQGRAAKDAQDKAAAGETAQPTG